MTEKNFAVLIDVSKCIGCRSCQVACKQWNNLPAIKTSQRGTYQNPPNLSFVTWNVVQFKEDFLKNGELKWFFRMHKCMHCSDPVCKKACPSQAIYKDEETGAVIIDQQKCDGAGICVEKCPWHIPKLDSKTGKASKCTFCIDRLKNKMEPACVKTCSAHAMHFGTKSNIYKMALARVKELKPKHPKASVYGNDRKALYGGLSNVYVLPEDISHYGL